MNLPNNWPDNKPDLAFDNHGWFAKRTRQALTCALYMNRDTPYILELGSYLGLSTRYILNMHPATVVAVDLWPSEDERFEKDAALNQHSEEKPDLYQAFLSNCWGYRDRLFPMRGDTITEMTKIARMGLDIGVVYVDAGHDYNSAYHDIVTALRLFPDATIVGDDFGKANAGVKKAVRAADKEYDRELVVVGDWGWLFLPRNPLR